MSSVGDKEDQAAFPQSLAQEGPFGGMTLRDYFAAKAMQGFVASVGVVGGPSPSDEDIARYSYDLAEAMLAMREDRYGFFSEPEKG